MTVDAGFARTSRMAVRAASCAILFVLPAFVHADPVRFDIASQPLPAALHAFAVQARMQLVYERAVVEGATGNGLSGELDRRAALEELLRGTGLEVVYSSNNAATIRAARPNQRTEIEKEPKVSSPADVRTPGVARPPL